MAPGGLNVSIDRSAIPKKEEKEKYAGLAIGIRFVVHSLAFLVLDRLEGSLR